MAANTIATLGAQLKNQYAPKIVNEVPSNGILQQYRDPEAPGMSGAKESLGAPVAVPISWTAAEKLGKKWIVPTKVQSGQGFSYFGESGALGTLNAALAMQIVEIQVDGTEVGHRSQVTYKASSTADGNVSKGYESAAQLTMRDMKDVMYNRIEISALWGQSGFGIGVLESQTISGAVMTAILTPASWCTAIWAANLGARVEFFLDGTTTFSPSGQQGSSSTASYATVTSFTASSRTVVFTFNSATGLTSTSVPPAASFIQFGGLENHSLVTGSPGTYNEMVGLYKQFSAATGTFFNQNRATYSLLQGQTYSAGSIPLTKAAVLAAAKLVIDKGNMNDLVLLVPTGGWVDLANEDMANRIFDSSYSAAKSESGSEFIEYQNLNGKIRVVCHPFMLAGYAFLFTPGQAAWVGSSDVTFNLPGAPQGKDALFIPIADSNGYEIRGYADKCIYHNSPSQAVVITNIVSSS